MGVMRTELVMKSIVPVVMVGALGIYGIIITGINPKDKPHFLFDGYAHLFSGLMGLTAGMAVGIVDGAGVGGQDDDYLIISAWLKGLATVTTVLHYNS
ncbi:hypothetical protein QYE76_016352 [Lolium multiflorum]|uniref:V-type proton ATPase proteolipid subunit n=1 Tax=Lolium multiflorum TaxID=4521 RepID=A0AAD8VFQ8_LOLMU|nr:hypothetical protein QYE76_016352 [Lolium multiflorum]